MKSLSIAVPCYNSAEYLERCVETLLPGGKDIEVILVNDGSTDDTPVLCDAYAAKYPDIVKVVHKENGGHGDAVNAGLREASGLYFKVVDSDDWLDVPSLQKIMEQIRLFVQKGQMVDLIINNYVYEHVLDNTSTVMRYTNIFPEEQVFSWQDCGNFRVSQYILMHSVIYRTELLKECGLALPKHTFYVDNIFVYQPLPYVKTIYYMDLDLYRYFIGRSDQSVNEKIMVKRVSQYIRVLEVMLEAHDLEQLSIENPVLAKYMTRHLSIVVVIVSILLFLDGNKESAEKHRQLWVDLKANYRYLYKEIMYRSPFFLASSGNRLPQKIAIAVYRLARRIFHFN